MVAARLSALAEPFARVTATDRWMPRGFDDITEAELDKAPVLPAHVRDALAAWWLAPASTGARTPNFDIASTCAIDDRSGLLLVEAKAHTAELENEAAGRRLRPDDSDDRRRSHETIGAAIAEARAGLERDTGLPWGIDRDTDYQMSNRFAWAWKLTGLSVAVVLVYLGFLDAREMAEPGTSALPDPSAWDAAVRAHAEPIVPAEAWNARWIVNGQEFVPLIRSLEIPLDLA